MSRTGGTDRNGSEFSPLHIACRDRKARRVKRLLTTDGCSAAINSRCSDQYGSTPLRFAILHADRRISEFLIENGACLELVPLESIVIDQDFPVPGGKRERFREAEILAKLLWKLLSGQSVSEMKIPVTCLHLAAERCLGGLIPSIEEAIDPVEWESFGSVHDVPDEIGFTPIFYAARAGHLAYVLCLLSKFAACGNARAPHGGTFLHEAALGGQWFVIQTVLDACENLDPGISSLLDNEGATWVHRIVQHLFPGPKVYDIFEKQRELIAEVVNIVSGDGTPLAIAVKHSNFALIPILLDLGADPHLTNSSGFSASHYAVSVEEDSIHSLEILRDRNGLCHKATVDGRTPLHLAVAAGHDKQAIFLADNGGDLLLQDAAGESPFTLAVSLNRWLLVQAFLLNFHVPRTHLPAPSTPNIAEALRKGDVASIHLHMFRGHDLDSLSGEARLLFSSILMRAPIRSIIAILVHLDVSFFSSDSFIGLLERDDVEVSDPEYLALVFQFFDRLKFGADQIPVGHWAAQAERTSLMAELHRKGKLLGVTDGANRDIFVYCALFGLHCALEWLASNCGDELATCLDTIGQDLSPSVFALLSGYALDLHRGFDDNRTPLLAAAYANHTQCAAFFISKGSDVCWDDIWGNTSLHYAAAHKNLALAKALISKGASVFTPNMDGISPLVILAHLEPQILSKVDIDMEL